VQLYFQKVLKPLCQILPDFAIYQKSLEISEIYVYSFYDSLILAGAIAGDCGGLYSEDFQDGQSIVRTKIANPFKSGKP